MKTQNKKLLVLTLILSTFLNVGVASAQSFAGFNFSDAKKFLTNTAEIALAEARRLHAEFEKRRAEDAKRDQELRQGQIAEQAKLAREEQARQQQASEQLEKEIERQKAIAESLKKIPTRQDSQTNPYSDLIAVAPEVSEAPKNTTQQSTKIYLDFQAERTHLTQDSSVLITRTLNSDIKWLMIIISKDGKTDQQVFPIQNGQFNSRVYLRLGPGIYNLTFYTNTSTQRATSYPYLTAVDIENRDERDLSFLLPSGEVESDNAQIIALAKNLTKDAANDEEALEKIHAYIIKTVKYDWDSFRNGTYANNPMNAVAVLNNPLTVCSGYSNLFAALARAAGIRSKVIHGKAKIPEGWYDHAWNEFYINDQWQVVDSTWNVDRKDNKYFFIDEATFAEDHKKEKEMSY